MENKTVGILISAFVAILLGVVLVNIIAEQANSKTSLLGAPSETISIASSRGPANAEINATQNINYTLTYSNTGDRSWRQDNSFCYITNAVFKNSSGATLTSATDYVLNTKAGTVYFLQTAPVNQSYKSNSTTATYQYCPNDVIGESWGRSVTNMIAGFFALGILGVGIFLVIRLTKDELE